MGRKRKNEYKYTIEELRHGEWKRRYYGDIFNYWHCIIKVNQEYDREEDCMSDVNYDLEEIFGKLEYRSKKEVEEDIFEYAPLVEKSLCFQCIPKWSRGFWYLDLHLRQEWHGKLDILVNN